MLKGRRAVALFSIAAVGFVLAVGFKLGCSSVRRSLITALTPDYEAEGDRSRLVPTHPPPDDTRARIDVELVEVAAGLQQPVDIQFVPGHPGVMLVVEQFGRLVRIGPDGVRRTVLTLDVLTQSEQGLLGVCFHPDYLRNGLLYSNATVESAGRQVTRIAVWQVPPGDDLSESTPRERGIVLEVEQPYQNHNAGQIAFGPDGMLYVGLGDGGFAGDPHGHSQNTGSLLGTMLRLDVDASGAAGYVVPPDNPFVGEEGARPEVWAYGLRNPWRYAFAPDGRLVVADVGQDQWEEVTVVTSGTNQGWNVREGAHCYPPGESCSRGSMVDPVWEYGRNEGASITGGYVYTGNAIPELAGRYVFADFVSGRIWGLNLPKHAGRNRDEIATLGKWPILPSTFGQDAEGELYLAAYGRGVVYKLKPKSAK